MDVLLCWGSCSETSSSGEHFQLVLIKQRLAAQVPRAISREIFESCLWLAAPNSYHLTAGGVFPMSAELTGCSHTTQPGKHSLQPGHQTTTDSIKHYIPSHVLLYSCAPCTSLPRSAFIPCRSLQLQKVAPQRHFALTEGCWTAMQITS